MSNSRFDPRKLGQYGEDIATQWYLDRGYSVLCRNWRCRSGELDIVLSKGKQIIICEVKTRSSARYGTALEAVGPAKQRKLRSLAAQWLREEAPFKPDSVRFDVAAVLGGKINVLESAL
ncbi:MAG: YraN family protein [Microthrixaceae bacterium]